MKKTESCAGGAAAVEPLLSAGRTVLVECKKGPDPFSMVEDVHSQPPPRARTSATVLW
jgi:hypothetical protein